VVLNAHGCVEIAASIMYVSVHMGRHVPSKVAAK
jgi:hypothetical protein